MSFGTRLKERREELGLKQSELGGLLGITGSAIGNYENGISSPKADILYRVFDVLKCDANYLFQDEMKELETDDITVPEIKLIKKYRQLDQRGQAAVLDTLNREYSYLNDDTVYMVARSGDHGQKTLNEEESRLADEATAELEKAVEGKHRDL